MTSTPLPEFSELKHKIFALLYETSDLLLKCEDAAYGESGLSQQQYLVLLSIECFNNSPARIIDIARMVNRNPNSISMIADRMERGGLVVRVIDLPDKRSVRLLLTDKGKEKLDQASKLGLGLIVRLTACFSEEELETLACLIGKLREQTFGELNPGKTIEDIGKPDMKVVKKLLYG